MGSTSGGNLKNSLITVSHMASCNLRNPFLEDWKLVQMHHFADLNSLMRVQTNSLPDQGSLNVVGI